jgi:hypothetical protein
MPSKTADHTISLPPQRAPKLAALRKAATGISGLDEVTGGGLPQGRPRSCVACRCGKTLLAMEFLFRGITEFGEPGVFISFEEKVHELVENVASMGFDLQQLQDDGLLVMDHVNLAESDLQEAGSWDLEGCSSASAPPSTRSAPSESCSTRSRRCSAPSTMSASCAPSYAGCSAG